MKKIYLLLLIATFSLNLFCQQDSVIVLDSTFSYRWDTISHDWIYLSKTVSFWSVLKASDSDNINYIVYPNPFSDYTTIRFLNANPVQHIDLIDVNGRIVRIIDNINRSSVTIHRENLTPGIYFIRIHSDDIYVKKVFIR